MKAGQKIWIITPSIAVKSHSERKSFSYLDIFYLYGQLFFQEESRRLKEHEKKFDINSKKRILIELDNKVVKLKFFSNEIRKSEKKLLIRKDLRKKIYDYRPYQIFIGLTESYLDTLHSIYELIREVDSLTGKSFSGRIWKEEWFRMNMDLRNLFHHIESPLCSVEKGEILFTFHNTEKLDRPKFFTEKLKNGQAHQVVLKSDDLNSDVFNFLESWAKKYLDLIDGDKEMELITGFRKNGRFRSEKVSLKELMQVVDKNTLQSRK